MAGSLWVDFRNINDGRMLFRLPRAEMPTLPSSGDYVRFNDRPYQVSIAAWPILVSAGGELECTPSVNLKPLETPAEETERLERARDQRSSAKKRAPAGEVTGG